MVKSKMRIFYAAGNQPHGSLTNSRIWFYNLLLPLMDLGYEIVVFDYDLEPHYRCADLTIPKNQSTNELIRPRLEEELLRQIQIAHKLKPIDLFFSYFYSSFVDPQLISEIHSLGISTVNWYCNASYQFHLIKELAPFYDYCLVPEKFRIDDYRNIGAKPIYCQEAANPNVYKPYNLPKQFDVTFIGAQYGDRSKFIRYLLDKRIDVNVWGPGWTSLCVPRLGKQSIILKLKRAKLILQGKGNTLKPILPVSKCNDPLDDDEMIKMYSRSKISLGFSKVGNPDQTSNPIKQVRLRDFEAPMCGAFYLVEYFHELEEFFKPEREIVFFYDENDLLAKVKFYLTHETEREEIRKAGFEKAVNEHSWQKRFQTAFKQMGFV